MGKNDWNTNNGNGWYNYLMEGCDGEEILRKKKHKDRRTNKSRRDKPLKGRQVRVYNGHVGTWVYEYESHKEEAQAKKKST